MVTLAILLGILLDVGAVAAVWSLGVLVAERFAAALARAWDEP